MKNITLSAPEDLIEQARRQASRRGTTLNQEFRQWLAAQTVSGINQAARYERLLQRLGHIDAGRSFKRDELNER